MLEMHTLLYIIYHIDWRGGDPSAREYTDSWLYCHGLEWIVCINSFFKTAIRFVLQKD